MDLALTLGSDVPFFIFGKTAWAEGRGEILREFSYQERFFLLSLPKLRISTKSAFNEISLTDVEGLTKENYKPDKYYNSFEKWVRSTYPIMDEIFLELQSIGNPRLSGTGSTIFVEYSNLKDAEMAKKEFPELVLTKSLERSPLMQIIE
jgi:4-diphosphocytidyl-2-C-methyl-D-erythritol kinase